MRVPLALLLSVSLTTSLSASDLALELLTSGVFRPVAITNAGDQRLFITEQSGRIRVWDGMQLLPTPFLDITDLVSSSGERGLLSVAFHPDYQQNGLFYVDYTDRNGNTVVSRFQVSDDPDRALRSSESLVLAISQPYANHNGGQLQFGPDGYLYIGMGDGGSGGDPQNRAQNMTTLLGKLLRIDVDGVPPYAIPPSNPFANSDGIRPEIWASGLRNPWRFSFDRATGDLWIADVGQGDWEEIDFQPASSIGGENYGWRLMEGTHCYNPPQTCNNGTLVLPVIEYNHANGACAVAGAMVYRGSRFPLLSGLYLYADYCDGIIRAIDRGSEPITSTALFESGFLISTFGEDATGEVYVADYGNGRIYHVVDRQPVGPRRRAVRH